jgi:hypothetical protein
MPELPWQHVFHEGGRFSTHHVHVLPAELTVCRWKWRADELSVPRGVHGSRRRELPGVRRGEVQGGYWLCYVHRLRRRQVPRNHRSFYGQYLHKLQCRHVLYDTGRF